MAREWTDDQIAENAGKVDGCITKLTERILSYTEYDGTAHTDGLTTDVLAALMTGGRNGIGSTYGDLGVNAPTIDDVTWAGLEAQKPTPYCVKNICTYISSHGGQNAVAFSMFLGVMYKYIKQDALIPTGYDPLYISDFNDFLSTMYLYIKQPLLVPSEKKAKCKW